MQIWTDGGFHDRIGGNRDGEEWTRPRETVDRIDGIGSWLGHEGKKVQDDIQVSGLGALLGGGAVHWEMRRLLLSMRGL